MMKTQPILKNNQGSILILMTIMLLMLVTIISFASLRTASTEIQIAGNEYGYQRNFYRAEGAAIEAVDRLEMSTSPESAGFSWLSFDPRTIDDTTVFSTAYWTEDASKDSSAARGRASSLDPATTGYLAVHQGVLAGNSLDMSKPTKHTFSIYGRCMQKGTTIIKVGYAKAY